MISVLYLSLFAAASAGSVVDDVLDRRIASAFVSVISHLAGFFGVLHFAMPEIGYSLASGLASLCVVGFAWDVWSSARTLGWVSRSTGCEQHVGDATLGVAVMFGARFPAYVCGALLTVGATT